MTVSVCVPARDEAGTIGPIIESLAPLREQGVVGQVVVVDASRDGTGEIAARLGAEVHRQESLRPEFGPVLGKGDAMWRALSVLSGDVVCFLHADSERFGPHFVCGLIGPVLCGPHAAFVKGYYRRPFRDGGHEHAQGGGRVTELMARPLLRSFYPELALVHQPLAGEIAARRDLLDRIAQVDLEVRQNRHRPLHELGPMSTAVLGSVIRRLEREGRLVGLDGAAVASQPGVPAAVERPPMASLRVPA